MKQKLIKLYSFNRNDISKNRIESKELDEKLISISESFLTYAYECYKNKKLEDGEIIEEIIRVMLSDAEEEAKLKWFDGLSFNDKKYVAWFATTRGMKKEFNGKYETLFIEESFKVFAE